jgi:predicted nucleotidyltransferase
VLAQRVADAFPLEVVEVVLTGSVSRGVADDVSDIEMLCVTEQQLSLDEAFELANRAGLERRESWGDPATPTRRVSGYIGGASVETIWWSQALAEEHFADDGSAEALANGLALRTRGLLAAWQERLGEYPDELAVARIEEAARRWGGFAPAALLTVAREDERLALTQWLFDSAQRVLKIVYALNRTWEPTTKRLASRVDALDVKPERFAARITEALTEPDPRRALATMTELQLETVRLVPSGPNVDRARTWLADALAVLQK